MRDRGFVLWVVLAAVLLTVLNLPGPVSREAKAIFREGVVPLQRALSTFSRKISHGFTSVRGIGDLVDQNQLMSAELVHLRNEVRDLQLLETENCELRKQLQFIERSPRKLISCEVIARDISGWWQTIRLSKGASEGVAPDMAVVTLDGLIGKIISGSSRTADVLLISDPSCKVSAQIVRTGSFGVLRGTGGSGSRRPVCAMEFINKNLTIQEGDEVVTSGLGGVFPKGLLIGYVERIYPDDTGLFQRADVLPKADLDVLDYVFVVAEEGDEIEAYLQKLDFKELENQ